MNQKLYAFDFFTHYLENWTEYCIYFSISQVHGREKRARSTYFIPLTPSGQGQMLIFKGRIKQSLNKYLLRPQEEQESRIPVPAQAPSI